MLDWRVGPIVTKLTVVPRPAAPDMHASSWNALRDDHHDVHRSVVSSQRPADCIS